MSESPEERLEHLGRPGDLVMTFVENKDRESELPRSISFVGIEFKPLGYKQLSDARLHLPVTVPLDWSSARVLGTDVPGLNIDSYVHGHTTLESVFSSTTVSLQRGGWLPSSLALSQHGATVLPDRNVVGQIKARYQDGTVVSSTQDFLDLLTDLDVCINPMLFAMESNGRNLPTPSVVESQLNEAVSLIGRALPKARLVVGDGSLAAALGVLEQSRADFQRKQAFLLEVAPALATPTSFRLMADRWTEALAAADRQGVRRDSLVVLAVLSSIMVPNSASPAKKLLKFGPGYDDCDAYNALADLRSLEILINLYCICPKERPALFTADKALALFWVGIQAHSFRRTGEGVLFDLAPVEELLPGGSIGKWQASISSVP